MTRRIVESREYKLMLKRGKFVGSEQSLAKAANEFWRALSVVMEELEIATEGNLVKIKKRQLIRVFDTHNLQLRHNHYVLRSRVSENSQKCEVTLKFRHPDRYIAQERALTAAEAEQETKFEEDIAASFRENPPFFTNYTFSATENIDPQKVPGRLKKLSQHYPELPDNLDGYNEDDKLLPAADFTALELVITGAKLQLSISPTIYAECALIAWYEHSETYDAARNNKPVIVEFSFRYGNQQEDCAIDVTQRALALFKKLQNFSWTKAKSMDKTDFLYRLAASRVEGKGNQEA